MTIEAYLDELADRLRGRGRVVRRVLAEAEDHLLSAAAAHREQGLADDAAEQAAVADFGEPELVARRLSHRGSPLTRALLGQAVTSLVLVAGIGLVSVGLSGLLALAAASAFGKPFVSGDAPGVVYTAERCAEFREYAPSAHGCAAAAVAHHFEEVVGYREDLGVLGLLVLLGWWVAVRARARRRPPEPAYDVLPAGFGATVGAALFGLAAVVALPVGLLQLAVTGRDAGAGALLSAGVVAAVTFAGFAVALWRAVTVRLG
ncbi:MAG: hypothetical protein QOI54_1023 [Actinomycetota bacterium]|jgi:hypothetical protein|nr:hypothetical protein [Actinomycetota bacterium]